MATTKRKVTSTKKPMTPKEVIDNKVNVIHPDIVTIVEEILSREFNGHTVSIRQDTIVNEFMKKNPDFDRKKLFDDHHMDFEPIFEKAGWKVVYDRPGWDENYEPLYKFSPKRKVR